MNRPRHHREVRQLAIEVRGLPAPQGSKRPVRLGNGRAGVVESSKAVGPWREAVRAECQGQAAEPIPGPVNVTVSFLLPRPISHFGTGRNAGMVRPSAPAYPAGVPDLDKLVRSTLDGLTAGGAIDDDARIVRIIASKNYGTPAGVRIWIEEAL